MTRFNLIFMLLLVSKRIITCWREEKKLIIMNRYINYLDKANRGDKLTANLTRDSHFL